MLVLTLVAGITPSTQAKADNYHHTLFISEPNLSLLTEPVEEDYSQFELKESLIQSLAKQCDESVLQNAIDFYNAKYLEYVKTHPLDDMINGIWYIDEVDTIPPGLTITKDFICLKAEDW